GFLDILVVRNRRIDQFGEQGIVEPLPPHTVDRLAADRAHPGLTQLRFGGAVIGADSGAAGERGGKQRGRGRAGADGLGHDAASAGADFPIVFARRSLIATMHGAPTTKSSATRLKAVSKAITAPCTPTARPTIAVALFAAALASTPRATSWIVVAAMLPASAGEPEVIAAPSIVWLWPRRWSIEVWSAATPISPPSWRPMLKMPMP